MRLKSASARLMPANHDVSEDTGWSIAAVPNETTQKTNARPRLAAGPAIAMKNSSRARFGSELMFATPPKMNRVIPFTGTP